MNFPTSEVMTLVAVGVGFGLQEFGSRRAERRQMVRERKIRRVQLLDRFQEAASTLNHTTITWGHTISLNEERKPEIREQLRSTTVVSETFLMLRMKINDPQIDEISDRLLLNVAEVLGAKFTSEDKRASEVRAMISPLFRELSDRIEELIRLETDA